MVSVTFDGVRDNWRFALGLRAWAGDIWRSDKMCIVYISHCDSISRVENRAS